MANDQAMEVAGQSTSQTALSQSLNFANILKPLAFNHASQKEVPLIPMKLVTLLHGVPYIKWTETEVNKINAIENLQHTVVGKFSYG